MYSKKYCCSKIERLIDFDNPIHDEVIGNVCYLAYLKVGERGWFLHDSDWCYANRVHTSTIKDVEYTDNQVIVTTQNTKYVFDLIVDDE
jgi:hypothetical protein